MPGISIIQKQQFTLHFRPGTADESVLNESFDKDKFFPGTPEYKPKAGHIIIDVGAHIGCFSMLASVKAPKGRIYSFEPSSETYQVLEKNIKENGFQNITIFQSALAAEDGKATLYHDTVTGNWGHTITKAISTKTEIVDCVSFESFIEREGIERIDFIKFNCEGAEFSILLKSAPALLRRVNCMLILYHGSLEENYTRKQLAKFLKDSGFHIHHRYRNKDDDSGWLIAYRANFFKNIVISLRTIPLRTSLMWREIRRKFRRAIQIISEKTG